MEEDKIVTDEDAQKIWEEILLLREELKAIAIDKAGLAAQAQELKTLGDALHENAKVLHEHANEVIAAAEAAETIANGNGETDEQA